MDFGKRLRELRIEKGMTLRALADAAGLNFTYLSKIENGRLPYTPAADKIRSLAEALDADALELLALAGKAPPELEALTGTAEARRFFSRAAEMASPDDWIALLDVLERRQARRKDEGTKDGKP